ncbi:YjbE family putative metal transport protein [Afipia felis]|jgi:YjbE family integral membrane protein|uniref:Integral membrane protein, YjbE family n=2 Tax=Afipia felis TaxID=1035 RepID=A0A380W9F4_AFIFE|nr:YjbE family putative metal transport protein [Afipia felis]EKS28504.1 YjbE family integral membrane protein [Afipia felis ATCC 53690]SUU77212.1 integral membrane protein, YjbE family [Afipia felis]SUU85279.1 integral membrane protein, YjbE family [Afipia felis]
MLDIFDTATIGNFFNSFYSELQHPQFWVALTKIIWINILLSGDNALVIALACRSLEPRQRMWGMVLGAGVAVFLRIIFTFIVASLLALPYLKLVGGIALLVIAAKLLVPEKADEDNVQAAQHLWAAVKIVAVADIIMSLDNVIAVAAAANGSVVLLVLGLLISIPMIIAGAALIMALLDRVPALVWLGAALLGWVAGEVIATDPGVHPFLQRVLDGQISLNIDPTSTIFSLPSHMQAATNLGELVLGLLGVAIVLVVGSMWRSRAMKEHGVPAEAATT